MKKNIFTLGAFLLLGSGLYLAQTKTTFIADKAYVSVKEGALLYSGLGLNVQGSGALDIYGNVMVTGDATSKLSTNNVAGGAKTDGGNIILRYNKTDADIQNQDDRDAQYGQLWISQLPQANITAIVDKEFRDKKHGSYQQMGLPFFNTSTQTLLAAFGKTFGSNRYDQNGIFKWNNQKPRVDAVTFPLTGNNATDYYTLGSKDLDFTTKIGTVVNPNKAANSSIPDYTTSAYVLRGVPFSDTNDTKLTTRLTGAGYENGQPISYGASGEVTNYYREKYNTYLQDGLITDTNPWANPRYGRDLYQFGNPFLTNLDLSQIGRAEISVPNDGVNIPGIQGIRYHSDEITTTLTGGTLAKNSYVITFTDTGVPSGDLNTIIKPMQTFVVKLRNKGLDDSQYDLKFNDLRRFKGKSRVEGEPYKVDAAKGVTTSSSVKQLAIISLGEDKKEISRTYYVVYGSATTGMPGVDDISIQAVASGSSDIGTLEEDKVLGGEDTIASAKYWLYINEANENDFAGKPVILETYNPNIKYLKFEIHENAKPLADQQSVLSSGKEFYIRPNGSGNYKALSNNLILPVSTDKFSLYYDKNNATLGTDTAVKASRTRLAYDQNTKKNVLLFDPNWNLADVKIYDMSGKLIFSKNKVTTKEVMPLEFIFNNGTYIVNAISEKGESFSGKLIK